MYLVPTYFLISYQQGAENNNGTAKRHSVDPHAESRGPGLPDEVSLLSHTVGHMQAKTVRLCNIARTASIEIDVTKTKSMRINASQEATLIVDGQAIEELIASPTWAVL